MAEKNKEKDPTPQTDTTLKPPTPPTPNNEEWTTQHVTFMALNVLSSSSIALTLKALFISNPSISVAGLVAFHMMCAMSLTHILYFKGSFTLPKVEWGFLFPYSFLIAFSVVFSNNNLKHNSIGMYQMSKLAVIPVIVTLETLLRWRPLPDPQIIFALIVVLFGLGIVTVHDITVTGVGLFWAGAAVLTIAAHQMLTGRQRQKNLSAIQLLHVSSPPAAFMLLLVIVWTGELREFQASSLSLYDAVLVLVSGVLSVVINFTVLFIIGQTSPVTYQVLGHLKSISLLVVGITLFQEPVTLLQLVGIVIALVGTARYGQLKIATK